MGGCYGLSKMFFSIVDIMSEQSQNTLNSYFIFYVLIVFAGSIWQIKSNLTVGQLWPAGFTLGSPGAEYIGGH